MPEQRPLDIDAAVTQRVPADVRITGDGSGVVFSLGWASTAGEHPVADLWYAATDGSSLRRLTAGTAHDSAPRLHPDGTLLAFISDRATPGVGALYLLALDGGEALRLSAGEAALSDPQWSPDGRQIAVLVTDADDAEDRRRKEERDDPVVVGERLKYTRLALLDVPPDPFGADGLTPSTPRPLLQGDWHVWEHAWSPDGAWIAAIVSRKPGMDETFDGLRVALLPAAGGEPLLVGGERGVYRSAASLAWAPDGHRLAFLGGVDLTASGAAAVWLVDPAAPQQPTLRFHDEDGTIEALAWPHDAWLALHRLTNVTASFWKLPVSDGPPRLALTGEQAERGTFSAGGWSSGIGGAFSRAGAWFASTWGDATRPREVWAGQTGGTARQLTEFNADLASRRFGRTEVVRWHASDGSEVEGLLIYPVDYVAGQRYPTILHTHGGPTWAWDDHLYADWHDWGQWLATNGYAVLLPNPRGSTGRGWRYALGNLHDLMGGDWHDSQAGIDALIERGIADPERLGVGGWSYGGYTTAWTITQTTRYKAAIVGAGVSNRASCAGTIDIVRWLQSWFPAEFPENPDSYWDRSPVRYVGAVATPTLILHGEKDERVPVSQGWELYNALKTMGVPTQLVIYPRQPHLIGERNHQRDLLQRVVEWFDRYLKC
ncbi:MAG: peptidase S9 [Chloroflexi bacterium]|nr:MAG: peptidase S9 [Chloroflexota bacterium]